MSSLLDLDLNPGVSDYKPARRQSTCKPKQSKFKPSAKLCEELADTPCTNCSVCGKAIPSRTATGKHPIMIIGMYPGKTEVSKNKFYTGDSGQYLIAVLTDKGFDVEHDVHMTNIMRCPRPLNEKDHYRDFSTEEIKRCGQYTINEIQQVEPSLIVLMGDLPLRFFFNKKSVTTSRGQVRIKGDYKFLTTYNAAHIIRENEDSIDRKAFEDDIQTAYEIYNGISRTSDRDYVLVKTIDQFDQVIDILSGEENLSVDVETYAPGGEKEKKALDPYSEGFQIISIAISSMENTGFCFLLEHPENPLTLNIVLPKLKALLEGKIPKIGQNIKYDFKVLGVHFNIFLNNIVFDTMVAHSLIDDRKGTHGLDRLALDFLGERSYKFEMGKIGTYIPRAEELCIRNCTDADYVLRLYPIFVKKLEDLNMYDYYMSVMAPATPALGYVEMKGIPANKERVAELVTNKGKTGYYDKQEVYEAQAKEFPEVKAIPNFNIQSSQDLGTLLFNSFCFPVIKETKGHKPSVDKDVIDDLIRTQEHPFLTVLKNYRECSKMLSTYLVPYLKLHIKKDGRVHSTFTQHIAATGRLSSVHPNLQNIPARIDAAQDIMSIFFREGWKIGLADYSQMELRILAEASNDPKMLQAFLDGIDLHALTGQELTKIIGAEVNRDRGKTFNFGVVYGMTEHGFVEKLGCSFDEAKMYLESYFKIYEGVKDYQERMQSHLRQYGYVETLFGRRRYLRMRNDNDEHALRQAINTPIQGTATDINTIALTKLVSIYLEKGFESFPISSIHDALMFEMHPDEEDLRDLNIHVMTHLDLPFMKRIPLKVDWTEGKSWAEAKLK